MRILHLASFKGNFGDVLNHKGLYRFIFECFSPDCQIDQEEIRDYYKIRQFKHFDLDFVHKVNEYDLLIIGGGNFFSPWISNSKTGTTFDIALEDFKKIKCPIWFNALGCEKSLGPTIDSVDKLREFLKYIFGECKEKQYLFTVRNDGSAEAMKSLFGEMTEGNVHEILDHGFNIDNTLWQSQDKQGLGIVLSGDRYIKKYNNDLETFYKDYARFIEDMVETRFSEVIFIPHTYYDLQAINNIIKYLPDRIIREAMSMAPLITTEDHFKQMTYYYGLCKTIISSRFHGCILALAASIPIVTLYADERVKNVVEGLGYEHYCHSINEKNVFETMKALHFNEKERLEDHNPTLLSHRVEEKLIRNHEQIKTWFIDNDFID